MLISQLVLDPDDDPGEGLWSPRGPIPPRLRAFGKYPNVDEWLPGDLLLVSKLHPNWVARQISSAQSRGGFHPEDARWQHAAVYIGEARILEATRLGVRYGFVYDYIGAYLLRLRRDPNLSENERWRIAIQAGFRLHKSYDFGAVFSLLNLSFRGFWRASNPLHELPRQSIICSQLYADAYTAVTGAILAPPLVTPAALSECPKLRDVSCHWRKIR